VRIVEPYVNESVSYVNDAVLNVNSAGFDAELAADARTLEDRPDLRPQPDQTQLPAVAFAHAEDLQ